MQILSFRGAATAAAMVFVSLFGTTPGAASAQDTAPVVVATMANSQVPAAAPATAGQTPATIAVAAATRPMSGAAWIAQGTTPDPAAAQPAAPAAVTAAQAAPIRADSLFELIGDMPVVPDLTPELRCLAQAVYFEARGEPIDGQLAVAEVVINRAKSDLYPDDYCAVVTQPAQFSFVHHGRIPTADESSAAWQRAVAIAEIAEQNLWQSKAADALYFHATYVNPSWAHRKVELAQIDTHIFYR